MTIKALIFDFDGLILDTESPEFQTWSEVYEVHDTTLEFSAWAAWIGGDGETDFDPYTHLETLTSRPVDRAAIKERNRVRNAELLAEQKVLPGVVDYLDESRSLGLKLAIASSSPYSWVGGHLTRLGLLDRFDAIKTADNVANVKPDPALFLAALAALDVTADQAIVFEDSPNGALAANRAGIFVVAVPNTLTRQLNLDHADLRLDSLADLPLRDLVTKARGQNT